MEIRNKHNIGDEVYYPAADLRMGRVFKSAITGIVIIEDEGKQEIVYQTGQSYAVAEEDVFKTAKPAQRRLVKIMKEKKDEISSEIDKAIKTIKGMDIDEVVMDLTAKEDEKEENETIEE